MVYLTSRKCVQFPISLHTDIFFFIVKEFSARTTKKYGIKSQYTDWKHNFRRKEVSASVITAVLTSSSASVATSCGCKTLIFQLVLSVCACWRSCVAVARDGLQREHSTLLHSRGIQFTIPSAHMTFRNVSG